MAFWLHRWRSFCIDDARDICETRLTSLPLCPCESSSRPAYAQLIFFCLSEGRAEACDPPATLGRRRFRIFVVFVRLTLWTSDFLCVILSLEELTAVDKGEWHCHRCGGVGHIAAACCTPEPLKEARKDNKGGEGVVGKGGYGLVEICVSQRKTWPLSGRQVVKTKRMRSTTTTPL